MRLCIYIYIYEICQFLKDDLLYWLFEVVESNLGPEVDDYLVRIDSYTLVRRTNNLAEYLLTYG